MATSYYTSGYTPPAGVTNADSVKKIQQQLTNAGYNIGSTGVDGIWGKNTQAAYTQYLNNTSGSGSSGSASTYDPYAAQRAQINATYDLQKANLDAQAERLAADYDRARSQAYVNARLGAIGNNEQAAALGLAGNLYAGPQSGFSETSRIAENIAMRNAINDATLQEAALRDEINRQIYAAQLERDLQLAQLLQNSYRSYGGAASRGTSLVAAGKSAGSSGSSSGVLGAGTKRIASGGEKTQLADVENAIGAILKTEGKEAARDFADTVMREQIIDEFYTLERADGMSGRDYINMRINEALRGK